MNPRFWLSVAFLISRIGLIKAAGQCHQTEYSIYGMSLKGHVFKTCRVRFLGECNLKCDEEPRCQSFNVIIGGNICELNSRTKEARPEDFKPDRHRLYKRRSNKRGTFHVRRMKNSLMQPPPWVTQKERFEVAHSDSEPSSLNGVIEPFCIT